MKIKTIWILVLLLVTGLLTAACGSDGQRSTQSVHVKPHIVTTTTMLTDLVQVIGGDYVTVEGLMGAGIDPHLYKPSAGDVNKMSKARLIIYNGLHLEGKMSDVFAQMQKAGVATLAVGETLDKSRLLESEEFDGNYDPHIWFDVENWMLVVAKVKEALIALEPAHKEQFEQNAAAYISKLNALHSYVQAQAKRVPEQSRVLITAHDAFNYFGRAYGFEVKGLQGISTAAEAGTADVRELADFIVQNKIAAIFVETSVPKKTIEALQEAVKARGFQVQIGGELFSDSLGEPGTPTGTYTGTIEHNINTIVKALLAE